MSPSDAIKWNLTLRTVIKPQIALNTETIIKFGLVILPIWAKILQKLSH